MRGVLYESELSDEVGEVCVEQPYAHVGGDGGVYSGFGDFLDRGARIVLTEVSFPLQAPVLVAGGLVMLVETSL